MVRSPGIGGVFFRATDPAKLARWYQDHLGIDATPGSDRVWWQERGPTVFAPFDADTDYFGRREQQFMVNFRVDDLDAALAGLRAAGARVDDHIEDDEQIGRFGWAEDPEGNRFELWQPSASAGTPPPD